jgi:Fanconi anemia group M protein
MAKEPMEMDYREYPYTTIEAEDLPKYTVTSLPTGDFRMRGKNHLIEHKEAMDFNQSLNDGSLINQIIVMQQNSEHSTIIISNCNRINYKGKMEHAKLGRIARIVASSRVSIVPVQNYDQLLFLAQKIFEKSEDEKGLRPIIRIDKSLKRRREAILGAIPLIGKKYAPILLKEFGSIQAIANASVEDLVKIKGIGKKKAEEIIEILCGEEEYGD